MARTEKDAGTIHKKIEDLMIPLKSYPHVHHGMTLEEAIRRLENSQIEIDGRYSLPRTILVFDDLNVLVGMLRRRDIIRGLEPEFLSSQPDDDQKTIFDVKADPSLCVFSRDKSVKEMAIRAKMKVSEFMQPIVAWVDYEVSLEEAICVLCGNDTYLLPVVKDGSVVGVIRSAELLREIARWIDLDL